MRRRADETVREFVMRISRTALGSALTMALYASAVTAAPRADDVIDARSLALMEAGVALQAKGDLDGAVGLYESAVAIDPRNRSAFVALAQIARVQGLPGKAIALYREALVLEPNDVTAIAGQGEAMVQKGAVELAKARLTDAKRACAKTCPQIASLEKAIADAAAKKVISAEMLTPKPIVTTDGGTGE
jgi:Tfp pilus assembly protein PilF